MRTMIVADAPKQRLALSDTVHKLGLDVVDSLSSEQLLMERVGQIDVWLVDVKDYNDDIQDKIAQSNPKSIVMGFLQAPYMSDNDGYVRWQKSLTRQLCQILDVNDDSPQKTNISREPWRFVLFLGASMGGIEAVKEFLDNISPQLPLAILLAHHFNDKMITELPKVLTRHNNWRCKLINTTQSLRSGTCLIAPIDKEIVCDSNGRVLLTKNNWTGKYQPNISTLLKNTSEVFGSQLIAIIFSGMGDDGSRYAKEIVANNSFLWAQDPATCKSPSQPQTFIETGVCQFVGSPKALAERVNKFFVGYRLTAVDLNETLD